MNICEDILRLSESDLRVGESGPAGGPLEEILVESLSRPDSTRASWCYCIASVLDTRVGA
ncbi:hypothetical protein [Streptomyces sp. NPDC001020]